jgi:acetyl esterase/lipase
VDVVYLPDLTYRTAGPRELKLDLLLPGRGTGPFPAVILLHGAGPFNKGRKGLLPFAEELARKGYVAAVVSYRCGPDAVFPGPVHDAKCAVRWLRAHAAEYRIDAGRVAVVGWSCGGYLACMVGMTSPADGLEGDGGHLDQLSHVQAVVSYSAPTDLGKWYDDSSMRAGQQQTPSFDKLTCVYIKGELEKWLGGSPAKVPERYARAGVAGYVHKGGPPVLLIHGAADKVVGVEHSQLLADKLTASGRPVSLLTLANAPHTFDEQGDMNACLAAVATAAFLDRHLNGRTPGRPVVTPQRFASALTSQHSGASR